MGRVLNRRPLVRGAGARGQRTVAGLSSAATPPPLATALRRDSVGSLLARDRCPGGLVVEEFVVRRVRGGDTRALCRLDEHRRVDLAGEAALRLGHELRGDEELVEGETLSDSGVPQGRLVWPRGRPRRFCVGEIQEGEVERLIQDARVLTELDEVAARQAHGAAARGLTEAAVLLEDIGERRAVGGLARGGQRFGLGLGREARVECVDHFGTAAAAGRG
mmetsp:Transcript_14151/g.41615  ORF Transcript_14151/g.41615 Transcript_14151/m.41615 type:complete len:220 (-) Transcript_14151:1099-1758(-)